MIDVGELCYYDYRILLRDAIIFEAQKTAAGRKWLDMCWVYEQTKPDRKALRKKFGRKEDNG